MENKIKIFAVRLLSQNIHGDIELIVDVQAESGNFAEQKITFFQPIWFQGLVYESGELSPDLPKADSSLIRLPNADIPIEVLNNTALLNDKMKPHLQFWQVRADEGQLYDFLVSENPAITLE